MTAIPPDVNTRWAEQILAAQKKEFLQAAFLGYKWADGAFFTKTLQEEFSLTPTLENVERYLERTSTGAAATHAKQIQSTFDRVKNEVVFVTEEGTEEVRGLTSREVARQLQATIAPFSDNYATLLARTGVNWSQNEGAMNRYRQAGIKHMQWWATADERTCPFCNAMHGRIISINESFLNAGETMRGITQDAEGDEKEVFLTGTSNASTDHPPLHPHCRCTILPVFAGLPTGDSRPGTIETPGDVPVAPTARAAQTAGGVVDQSPAALRSQSIKVQENIIRARKIEHAAIIDSNGEVVFTKKGKKHSVGFTQRQLNAIRGNTLTHNHPGGGTFSPADISFLKSDVGVAEMRAATKTHNFSIAPLEGLTSTEIDAGASRLIKEHPKWIKARADIETRRLAKMVNDGTITRSQAVDELGLQYKRLDRQFYRENSELNGFKYIEETL